MKIDHLLNRYQDLVLGVAEMAQEWDDMDSHEQALQRDALLPYWEKRRQLSELHHSGALSDAQARFLSELDNKLIQKARDVEKTYGPNRDQLLELLDK